MKTPLNGSSPMLNHSCDDEQEFGCQEQDEADFNGLKDSYFDFDE